MGKLHPFMCVDFIKTCLKHNCELHGIKIFIQVGHKLMAQLTDPKDIRSNIYAGLACSHLKPVYKPFIIYLT